MTDITLYIDLDNPIDPAPQLAMIRKSFRDRLVIYCRKPCSAAEENYMRFFEEFHPIIKYDAQVASRLVIGSDIEYDHQSYRISALDIPTGPFLPVTGEFLQGLCDYTITYKLVEDLFGDTNYYTHSRERHFFIEDEWPPHIFQATSLFIHPSFEGATARRVFSHAWPNLRLIVFHNSDYPVHYRSVVPFLEANPKVWCWAENAIEWHPRIKVVPIGEQNRRWRGGDAFSEEPTVTTSRNTMRDVEILVPFWRCFTNPIRTVWNEQARERGLPMLPEMAQKDYLEKVTGARALVCPPGNGLDTHRHWDALRQGAWAVVEDNDHTRYLLQSYPSLHLIPVEDLTSPITIPEGLPPFHPVMLRAYWEVLFVSHI
jgi:hypothetical protein